MKTLHKAELALKKTKNNNMCPKNLEGCVESKEWQWSKNEVPRPRPCLRPSKTHKAAKLKCAKFFAYAKGNIQTKSEDLQHLFLSACCGSLLIYYFTPILAPEAIRKDELNSIETATRKYCFSLTI